MIHPDYLLQSLTSRQWEEWKEYARLEPFGFPSEDLRHGILCATVAAPHTKKGAKPPRAVAFMLRPEPYEEGDDEGEVTVKDTEVLLDGIFGIRGPPAKG